MRLVSFCLIGTVLASLVGIGVSAAHHDYNQVCVGTSDVCIYCVMINKGGSYCCSENDNDVPICIGPFSGFCNEAGDVYECINHLYLADESTECWNSLGTCNHPASDMMQDCSSKGLPTTNQIGCVY
jgi:hypothetical protein